MYFYKFENSAFVSSCTDSAGAQWISPFDSPQGSRGRISSQPHCWLVVMVYHPNMTDASYLLDDEVDVDDDDDEAYIVKPNIVFNFSETFTLLDNDK